MSPKPIAAPTMLDGVNLLFFAFLSDFFISHGKNGWVSAKQPKSIEGFAAFAVKPIPYVPCLGLKPNHA